MIGTGFARLKGLVDSLRELSGNLLGSKQIDPISLSEPSLPMDELYFRKSVSWCYALLMESGVFFRYSRKLLRGANPAAHERLRKAVDLVTSARTVQEHNLRPDRASDVAKKRAVDTWMFENGGDPPDWEKCSAALIDQICDALTDIHATWRDRSSVQEDLQGLRADYISERSVSWEAHQFDPYVQEAAESVGFSEFDSVRFRNSNGRLDRWRNLAACLGSREAGEAAIRRAIRSEIVALFGAADVRQ